MSGQGETAHLNGTNGTDAISSNPNIKNMSEGAQFVSFTSTTDGDKTTINKMDVFVFYEPEGKLGTLFWCEPGKREKDATRSLLLDEISDVFLGKQTAEFKSKEVADVPSNRCFSLISKVKKERSLHLRAASPDVRNAWLDGIKDIFSLSAQAKKAKQAAADKEKKLAKTGNGNGAANTAPATGTAASTTSTAPATTTTTTTATPVPAATPAPAAAAPASAAATPAAAPASAAAGTSPVDLMRAGSRFVGYFGTNPPVKKNITVWLDSTVGRLGALYWVEGTEKKPVDDQYIMFHKISDVFLGKQSPELKTCDAPAGHCFSIVSTKPSSSSANANKPPPSVLVLHLQAESEAVRIAWLDGIKEIFMTSTKKDKDAKKDKAAATPAPATTAAAAANNATAPAAATTSTTNTTTAPTTTTTATPAATPVPTAAAATTTAAPASASASGATGPVAVMAAGTPFTAFFSEGEGEGGAVTKKPIFAFYDDGEGTGKWGSIYWTPNQGKKEKDPSRQLPLHKISDVHLGKRTTVLKSSAAADVPSSQCFSIVTKERSLHLQADAESTRLTWLNGIKSLVEKYGKKVDEKKKDAAAAAASATAPAATTTTATATEPAKEAPKTETKAEETKPAAATTTAAATPATTTAPVAAATASTGTPAAATSVSPNVAAIIEGKSFTAFFDKVNPTGAVKNPKKVDPAVLSQAESREIVKRNIFVWYEPSQGKLGTLHYNTEGKKQIQPVNIPVPLHEITDVFLGKQTIELKSSVAASSHSLSCFAIITPVQQLHLVADNETTRKQWLDAITEIFSNYEKKKKETSQAATAPNTTNATAANAAATPAVAAAATTPATVQSTTPAPATNQASSTAPAPAPATSAAADTSSTEERDVAALVAGDVFTAYFDKKNTVAKQIVVWLEPKQAKFGVLFWNEDLNSREQKEERSLIFHRISDVFMGKQSPELKSPAAASAPTNTCFCIRTKDNRSLHLQAKSEAVRAQWVKAIKHIFANAGKKVDDADKNDKTATATTAAATAPTPAAATSTTTTPAATTTATTTTTTAPASTSTSTASTTSDAATSAAAAAAVAAASNIESIKAGREMLAFFAQDEAKTQVTSKRVLLWYEDVDAGELGSLYWNEPGNKTRVETQVMPLHKVCDVYIGKRTPELKSSAAEPLNHKHCFAFLTKTTGLHLAANSEEDRNLFLGCVKEIFSTGKKVVQDSKKAANATATAPTTSAAAATPATTTTTAAPTPERRASQALIETIIAGQKLEAFFGKETTAEKKSVFVFLEPASKAGQLGTLYWTEDGSRQLNPSQSIPLDKVSDVYAGKQSAALKSQAASSYKAKQCWSIVSKERALHLAAPTEEIRTVWLNALQAAFNRDNATAIESRPAEAVTTAKAADTDHIDHITKGRQVTQYVTEGGKVVKKSSFLYYVPSEGKYGTLYVAPSASQRDQRDEKTSIPLQSITDVYSGKKTTELKSSVAASASPVNCFSIVSKKEKASLHIEAESQAEATAWLDGIKAAFTSKGKSVKETVKSGAAATATTPATTTATSAAASTSPTDKQSILIKGQQFIGYFGTPESLTAKNIIMYLEPNEGRLGTFYYYDASATRTKDADNSIPLRKISDVYLGKQTRVLQSPIVTGGTDTCFTIVTRKTVLNLQATNAQARNDWLNALHQLFSSSGKKVVEDEPRTKPSVDVNAPGTAKTEAYQVTSPYGIGTVEEAPRADGIVPVKLPWSTAYMHQSAIDRVRTVHTTMGTGKLVSQPRTDGIIPVELPFGIAYMHEDSVDKESRKLILKDGRTVHLLGPLHDGRYHVRLENGALSTVTKDDIQEDNQALVSPTSASKLTRDDSTRILKQGATFTSFPSATDKPTQIDLFLDENEGKLGTIYASAVGSREKDATKALPLHRITDLFLGKQTAALLGPAAASTPDSRCFSIISKVHKVDVAADSEKTRNNWLYAIHGILTSSGRKVIEEKVPASSTPTPAHTTSSTTTSSSSSLAAPAERPRRYSVSKPELPTVEAATAILTAGSSFHSYVKSGNDYLRRPTFAYLDTNIGKLGAIILSDDGSKKNPVTPERTFKLDEMRDIYLGKRTPALSSAVAKSVSPDHTFSVLLKDKRSLDLEASNKDTREKWFFGLYAILSASQKKVIRKDSTQPAAIAAAVPKLATPSTTSTTTTTTGVGSVLNSGQRFMVHRGDTTKSTSEPCYMFYDESIEKLGSLILSTTETRSSQPAVSIPLHEISDVFIGKQTAAFKSPQNVDTPITHCFSLVTSKHMLNLQASSEDARTAWINDFKAVYAKRAAEAKAKKAAEKAERAKQGIVSPRATEEKTSDMDDATLQSMKAGRNFISYTADPPSATQVLVWFVPEDRRFGTLYWSTNGKKEKNESQSLALHRITDMYLGKQTPVLQLKEHSAAFSIRCFSIVSKKTSLHLEAESREERDAWLNKINQIIQKSGKRVVDKVKSTYERPAALPTVPKDLMAKMTLRRPSILAIPPHGTVRMMEHGSVFTRHRVGETPTKITVFYQSDAKLGTLFWYTGRDRVARTSQSLPLNQVTDVMLGKQTPAFKASTATNVNEVLCFALLASKDSLELEAESTEQLTAWLFGLNSLLTTSGRKIVLEEPNAGTAEAGAAPRESTLQVATHAPRRYSVMASELPALAGTEGEGEPVEAKSSLEGTHIALPSDITTRIITKGTNFTFYSATQDPREVFLFYEAAPGGGLGSIYWCAPGTRNKNETNSLALLDISRVYVGKAPAILKGAEKADPDRFVTFTTKDSTNVSFEARSEESLSAWLQSINSLLLNMAFKKVQLDASQADTNTSRSFVVVDPAAPSNDQPASFTHFDAALTEREHKYSASAITVDDPTLYDSPERLQAVISQGAVFTGYSAKGKRIMVRKIFVFYDKDTDGDQYLYWSEPGSRIPDVDNALDLEEISEVKVGTPVLSKVDDPNRVLIVKGEQIALELVAETAYTAKAFAEAIKVLIKNHGQL